MKLIRFIVRQFSHKINPIEWIAGKCKEGKEVLLPMPSINPAAIPIEIPSYIGPKDLVAYLAYEISVVFDISNFKVRLFSVHSE